MGHAKELLDHLTYANAVQCDKCGHLFVKEKISPYDISFYGKSGHLNLCKNCAREWFDQVNMRYHYLDKKKQIEPDNDHKVDWLNE